MSNIQDPRLLWLKGSLFVLLGLISLGLVVLLSGNFSVVIATLIAIWAFCRAYYFAFYVVERYIDRRYRFAGLTSVLNYWISTKLPKFDEKEASPGQSFVDAHPIERSRWNAIRCWLVVLISPVTYWLVREVVFDSEFLGVELLSLDLPLMGAWLSVLAYWTAKGSPSWINRFLLGFSAVIFGCSFFSLFPFTLSYLWEHLFVVPPDLSASVACCGFFCSSLAMQFLFARLDGTRLEDQICPVQEIRGNIQWSIRLMICVMVVTAINLWFWTRTDIVASFSSMEFLEQAILSFLGGLFLSPVTFLVARIQLRLGMRANWGWYLFLLFWSFVCIAIIAVTHFIFGDWPYWDDLRMLFMIYWIHLIAALITFRMLRSSGVFLRSV
jgi:hypothetical protein